MILYGYLFSYLYLFGVIFFIGALQKLFRFDVEISRKVIHFFIGFVWLILHKYHAGTWHFLVVPISFVVINYASYKLKIFKMFEREDEKNHYGTIFYAVAMTVMSAVSLVFPQTLLPYGLAVFCLSFGDAAAALCGKYIRKGNNLFVSGKLRTRKWTDKDNNVRYSTEIVADNIQMLDRKPKNQSPIDEDLPDFLQ